MHSENEVHSLFSSAESAAAYLKRGQEVVTDLHDGDTVYRIVSGDRARDLAEHRAVNYLSRQQSREKVEETIDTDVHDGWILDSEAHEVRDALGRILDTK